MQKLSVLIFSRNDVEKTLALVNDVYDVADEIVLVDSSNRASRSIIQKEKVKSGLRKLRTFYVIALGYPDPLRMYALKLCRFNWVLLIDTDERLSQGLRSDVKRVISTTRADAFAVKRYEKAEIGSRRNFTWQTRLFKRDRVVFKGLLHEQAAVNGRLHQLSESGYFMEHHAELRPPTEGSYEELYKFDRFSYELYNQKIMDYLSKIFPSSRSIEKRPIGKFTNAVLLAYERIRFKKHGDELSDFDYSMLSLLRNAFYFLSGVFSFHLAYETFRYETKQLKKWRQEPDSSTVFEISKIINRMGVTRFLNLDDKETISELNKEYENREQGARLLSRLLKERYAEYSKGKQ